MTWALKESSLGQEEDITLHKKRKEGKFENQCKSSAKPLKEKELDKAPFGELCEIREKGHQVTPHSSLSHIS